MSNQASNTNCIVAFIGKQDPLNMAGQDGPLLSAVSQLPCAPDAALLLYCEGASDRADNKDEARAAGLQQFQAQEVAEELQKRFAHIEVTTAELQANPSHARELWEALRQHPQVQAWRQQWENNATVHVLIAGGTPAMREVLTSLHVGGFFGQMRGWYTPDREPIREEVPLATQTVYLSGAALAVELGEYALAAAQLGRMEQMQHAGATAAGQLLAALLAYQDGNYSAARQTLAGWQAPAHLQAWRKEALDTLEQLRQPFGQLLALWNEVQQGTARNALLSYATLLERALKLLAKHHQVGSNDPDTIVSLLPTKGIEVPNALNRRMGEAQRLNTVRNKTIHDAAPVGAADGDAAKKAATALLLAFGPLVTAAPALLRQPHKNAFAPNRRPELAQALAKWLTQ